MVQQLLLYWITVPLPTVQNMFIIKYGIPRHGGIRLWLFDQCIGPCMALFLRGVSLLRILCIAYLFAQQDMFVTFLYFDSLKYTLLCYNFKDIKYLEFVCRVKEAKEIYRKWRSLVFASWIPGDSVLMYVYIIVRKGNVF